MKVESSHRESAKRSEVVKSFEAKNSISSLYHIDAAATETVLCEQLKAVRFWRFPKTDLYVWLDVLDRFDSILEAYKLESHKDGFKSQLVSEILRFTYLLLRNCSHLHVYNSLDHLIDYLCSFDLSVVSICMKIFEQCLLAKPDRFVSFRKSEFFKHMVLVMALRPIPSFSSRTFSYDFSSADFQGDFVPSALLVSNALTNSNTNSFEIPEFDSPLHDIFSKLVTTYSIPMKSRFSLLLHMRGLQLDNYDVLEVDRIPLLCTQVAMRLVNGRTEIEMLLKSDMKFLENIFEILKTKKSVELRICAIKAIKTLVQTCSFARRCIIDMGFCARGGLVYSLVDQCVADASNLSADELSYKSSAMHQLVFFTQALFSLIHEFINRQPSMPNVRSISTTDILSKLLEMLSLPSFGYIQVLSQCIIIVGSLCDSDNTMQSDLFALNGVDTIIQRLDSVLRNPSTLTYIGSINESSNTVVPEHRFYGFVESLLNTLISIMKPVSIDNIRFKSLHNGMFAGLFTYIWEVAAARIESLPLLNFDKDFVENFRFKASNVSIIDGNIPINSVESLPLISSDAISVSTATVAYSLSCKLLAQVLQSASIRTTFHDSGVTVAFLRTINKALLKDSVVLNVLPELLRSFCLSLPALGLLQAAVPSPIIILLDALVSPTYLTYFDPSTLSDVVRGIEELVRHIPAFKIPCCEAVVHLLKHFLTFKSVSSEEIDQFASCLSNAISLVEVLAKRHASELIKAGLFHSLCSLAVIVSKLDGAHGSSFMFMKTLEYLATAERENIVSELLANFSARLKQIDDRSNHFDTTFVSYLQDFSDSVEDIIPIDLLDVRLIEWHIGVICALLKLENFPAIFSKSTIFRQIVKQLFSLIPCLKYRKFSRASKFVSVESDQKMELEEKNQHEEKMLIEDKLIQSKSSSTNKSSLNQSNIGLTNWSSLIDKSIESFLMQSDMLLSQVMKFVIPAKPSQHRSISELFRLRNEEPVNQGNFPEDHNSGERGHDFPFLPPADSSRVENSDVNIGGSRIPFRNFDAPIRNRAALRNGIDDDSKLWWSQSLVSYFVGQLTWFPKCISRWEPLFVYLADSVCICEEFLLQICNVPSSNNFFEFLKCGGLKRVLALCRWCISFRNDPSILPLFEFDADCIKEIPNIPLDIGVCHALDKIMDACALFLSNICSSAVFKMSLNQKVFAELVRMYFPMEILEKKSSLKFGEATIFSSDFAAILWNIVSASMQQNISAENMMFPAAITTELSRLGIRDLENNCTISILLERISAVLPSSDLKVDLEKLFLIVDAFHSVFKSECAHTNYVSPFMVLAYTCSYARSKGVFSPHINPDSIEDLAERAAEFIILTSKDQNSIISALIESVQIPVPLNDAANFAEYHVRFYVLTILLAKGGFTNAQVETFSEIVKSNLDCENFFLLCTSLFASVLLVSLLRKSPSYPIFETKLLEIESKFYGLSGSEPLKGLFPQIHLTFLHALNLISSPRVVLDPSTSLTKKQELVICSLLGAPASSCGDAGIHEPRLHSMHIASALEAVRYIMDSEADHLSRAVFGIRQACLKFLSQGGPRRIPLDSFFRLFHPLFRRNREIFWKACVKLTEEKILSFNLVKDSNSEVLWVGLSSNPSLYKVEPPILFFETNPDICKLSVMQLLFDHITSVVRSRSNLIISSLESKTERRSSVQFNMDFSSDSARFLCDPFTSDKLLSIDILFCFLSVLLTSHPEAYVTCMTRAKPSIIESALKVIMLPVSIVERIESLGVSVNKARMSEIKAIFKYASEFLQNLFTSSMLGANSVTLYIVDLLTSNKQLSHLRQINVTSYILSCESIVEFINKLMSSISSKKEYFTLMFQNGIVDALSHILETVDMFNPACNRLCKMIILALEIFARTDTKSNFRQHDLSKYKLLSIREMNELFISTLPVVRETLQEKTPSKPLNTLSAGVIKTRNTSDRKKGSRWRNEDIVNSSGSEMGDSESDSEIDDDIEELEDDDDMDDDELDDDELDEEELEEMDELREMEMDGHSDDDSSDEIAYHSDSEHGGDSQSESEDEGNRVDQAEILDSRANNAPRVDDDVNDTDEESLIDENMVEEISNGIHDDARIDGDHSFGNEGHDFEFENFAESEDDHEQIQVPSHSGPFSASINISNADLNGSNAARSELVNSIMDLVDIDHLQGSLRRGDSINISFELPMSMSNLVNEALGPNMSGDANRSRFSFSRSRPELESDEVNHEPDCNSPEDRNPLFSSSHKRSSVFNKNTDSNVAGYCETQFQFGKELAMPSPVSELVLKLTEEDPTGRFSAKMLSLKNIDSDLFDNWLQISTLCNDELQFQGSLLELTSFAQNLASTVLTENQVNDIAISDGVNSDENQEFYLRVLKDTHDSLDIITNMLTDLSNISDDNSLSGFQMKSTLAEVISKMKIAHDSFHKIASSDKDNEYVIKINNILNKYETTVSEIEKLLETRSELLSNLNMSASKNMDSVDKSSDTAKLSDAVSEKAVNINSDLMEISSNVVSASSDLPAASSETVVESNPPAVSLVCSAQELEELGLSSEVMSELPEDIQREILQNARASHGSNGESNSNALATTTAASPNLTADLDADFISMLELVPLDIREDMLIQVDDDRLSRLPRDIVNEANRLRRQHNMESGNPFDYSNSFGNPNLDQSFLNRIQEGLGLMFGGNRARNPRPSFGPPRRLRMQPNSSRLTEYGLDKPAVEFPSIPPSSTQINKLLDRDGTAVLKYQHFELLFRSFYILNMDLDLLNRLFYHLSSCRLPRLFLFRTIMAMLMPTTFPFFSFGFPFLPRPKIISKFPDHMYGSSSDVKILAKSAEIGVTIPAPVFTRLLQLLNYFAQRNCNLLNAYFFYDRNNTGNNLLKFADTYGYELEVDSLEKELDNVHVATPSARPNRHKRALSVISVENVATSPRVKNVKKTKLTMTPTLTSASSPVAPTLSVNVSYSKDDMDVSRVPLESPKNAFFTCRFPRLLYLFGLFDCSYVKSSSETLEQLLRLLMTLFLEITKLESKTSENSSSNSISNESKDTKSANLSSVISSLVRGNSVNTNFSSLSATSLIPEIPIPFLRSFVSNLNSDRCPERIFKLAQPMISTIATNIANRNSLISEVSQTTEKLSLIVESKLREELAASGSSKFTVLGRDTDASGVDSNAVQYRILRNLRLLKALVTVEKQSTSVTVSLKQFSTGLENFSILTSLNMSSLWSALDATLVVVSMLANGNSNLLDASKPVENTKHDAKADKLNPVLSSALRLVPLIESYFIVNAPSLIAIAEEEKEIKLSKPAGILRASPVSFTPEGRYAEFWKFSFRHRRLLNMMIRNQPDLLMGRNSSSSLKQNQVQTERIMESLIHHPKKILDFENKKLFFKSELSRRTSLNNSHRRDQSPIRLKVRRQHVFQDSFHQFMQSKDKCKNRLIVEFQGEEGVDAGGVTREWFSVLSREIFNPNYALFSASALNSSVFQPNRFSELLNPDHLKFFRFVGRFVGKAVYDGQLIDAYFTRSFYKHILGVQPSFHDIESIDPEFYKSLKWMLDNSVVGVLDQTFSIEFDKFGEQIVVDLIPNGRNILVTDENKAEYVHLVTEQRMTKEIEKQTRAFLEGFQDLIPQDLISVFNEQEMELLTCGYPDFELDDLRNNTEYQGYRSNSLIIQWFWSVVQEFDKEERALLLQFVTGTSRVPSDGFANLVGSHGVQKFSIQSCGVNDERLPISHTCFNQLDLPEYSSREILREKLLYAIRQGAEGFGFQ